ncbi:MAG TPA: hypothetical protein VGC80_12040 [Acetobacteraceae bacterium]
MRAAPSILAMLAAAALIAAPLLFRTLADNGPDGFMPRTVAADSGPLPAPATQMAALPDASPAQ